MSVLWEERAPFLRVDDHTNREVYPHRTPELTARSSRKPIGRIESLSPAARQKDRWWQPMIERVPISASDTYTAEGNGLFVGCQHGTMPRAKELSRPMHITLKTLWKGEHP